MKLLYHAPWNAWSEYALSIYPNSKTAAIMSLHTAGDLLNFHPHLHCLILAGVVDENNCFHQIKNIDSELIEALFSEQLFRALLDRELITEEVVSSMRSWEHSGFRVLRPPTSGANLWCQPRPQSPIII